jgi:hypothetical protein
MLRDVAEPLESLADLLLVVGVADLGELLLEGVGDELLDRRAAGDLGVLLILSTSADRAGSGI